MRPLLAHRIAPAPRLFASPGDTAAIAPDGSCLAELVDGRLRLWDTRTWESTEIESPAVGDAGSAAFVDPRVLVTTGTEGVMVWDVGRRELLATLTAFGLGDAGQATSEWIAISRDGAYDGSSGASRYIAWRFGASGEPRQLAHDPARLAAALAPTAPPLPRTPAKSAATDAATRPSTADPAGLPGAGAPAAIPVRPAATARFPRVRVAPSNQPRSETLVEVPESSVPRDVRAPRDLDHLFHAIVITHSTAS